MDGYWLILVVSAGVVYLAIGIFAQRQAFRIPVGERNHYGPPRRRIADPNVPAWGRVAVIVFWPFILLVLLLFTIIAGFLTIVENIPVIFRYVVLGDTKPEEPALPNSAGSNSAVPGTTLVIQRVEPSTNGAGDSAEIPIVPTGTA